MRRALAVSIACLLAASCGGTESEALDADSIASAEQEVRASPAGYELSVAATMARRGRFGESFAIEELDSLHFALDVPDVPGRHVAQLVVYSDGDLPYISYEVAYAVRVPARDGERQARRGDRDERRVWVSMPVAGTWIQQFQLTGNWRAEAFVDGGEIGPISTSFTLR